MDIGRILKWAMIALVAFIVWKTVIPWVKRQTGSSSSSSSAGPSDHGCPQMAARASEAWGSGLGRFINPPYDVAAWSTFRGDVDARISAAESQCSCQEESCQRVRGALTDLRGLVGQFDTAIRNGAAPPDDAVQRQESIDNRIQEGGDLLKSGK